VPKVSVTIIALNEAEHIGGAIDSAAWADEILLVDAGSSDGTREIASAKGATVFRLDGSKHVESRNFAADRASNDWIFSLDADERITPALAAEIRALVASEPPMRAYRGPRVTYHLGRWIRTTDFYPDYQTRLYHRHSARWDGKYVHESVRVDGPVGRLQNEIEHYSFRDLRDQLERINHYSTLSALQMRDAGRRARVLDLFVQPPAAFLRNYVMRRGVLDGAAGFTISVMNTYYVFLKFAKLWELQQGDRGTVPHPKT
jgi:glycosyltransferase involved in cell wall biosynthesis